MAFTHLHVHTEYSLLDGMTSVEELIACCKKHGMDSCAITDHGNMFGAIEFYKKAKAAGIKPIIGCELYTAARTRHDKEEADKFQGHLTLLAENEEGYHNLCRLNSLAYLEGFYYKPRVDWELLEKYHNGIIALSGCIQGDVQKRLTTKNYDGAKEIALRFEKIFGKGNFFLEIQNQHLEEEREIYADQRKMSKELGMPLVATNDVHYAYRDDFEAHDALLCIQTGKKVDDHDRMRFPNDEFYFKSEQEMLDVFPEIPEAVAITHDIAERCDISFPNIDGTEKKYHLPKFDTGGEDPTKTLRRICNEGLEERYGEEAKKHVERLEYELDVIEKTGFVEYFLIVWDFVRYAKKNGISVGPGRGSAAGSLVSYSLGITDIDPIKYNLLFERFLNSERISMPDIDIDFDDRDKMIDYVTEKYGEDKVSQIITFGRMKAKAVVKDVGRVFDIDFNEANALTKMLPNILQTDKKFLSLKDALEESEEIKAAAKSGHPVAIELLNAVQELRRRAEADDGMRIRKMLRVAVKLENRARNAGIHAAGVVITDKPIYSYLPLAKNKDSISTQFTMGEIEELGLLKMDFLGLKNLTVIRDAIAMIEKNHGKKIDFSKTDYSDKKTYKTIASGNTEGIFQLESPGMTSFMRELKPTSFEDVIAGISLFRPGPMDSIPKYIQGKRQQGKIRYTHPSLESILSVTYGCIVYQEQVMQIVRDLAGYDYARSDLVRRAMGKKKGKIMEQERKHFIYGKEAEAGEKAVAGCIARGIPEDVAGKIFDDMASFASYAFNRSHAAGYAAIAYQTAYLKTHYPKEFMAALMTSAMGDNAKIARYIKSAAKMGIEVLPPNVLTSEFGFTVSGHKIAYALGGLKGVGRAAIEDLISKRSAWEKPPETFQEFIESVDKAKVTKTAVEAFIMTGAMKSFPGTMAQHLAIYPQIADQVRTSDTKMKSANKNQLSFFDTDETFKRETRKVFELPDVNDIPQKIKLEKEREIAGVYFSKHPLSEYSELIEKIAKINDSKWDWKSKTHQRVNFITSDLGEGNFFDKQEVRAVLFLTESREITTKKGEPMAFATGEDESGVLELVIFPNTYRTAAEHLQIGEILVVQGKLDLKDDGRPKILADKLTPIEKVREFMEQAAAPASDGAASDGAASDGAMWASPPTVADEAAIPLPFGPATEQPAAADEPAATPLPFGSATEQPAAADGAMWASPPTSADQAATPLPFAPAPEQPAAADGAMWASPPTVVF